MSSVRHYEVVRAASAILFTLLLPASLPASSFGTLSLTLRPKVVLSPLPAWTTSSAGTPLVNTESDSVDIPVPALASQDEIACFALTIVFEDNGDGGPTVEWMSRGGEQTLLSAGLGQLGLALGLNARTILLPQAMTLDGGTARVTFAGRFTRLISVSLQPARELGVAALETDFNPALIESEDSVLDSQSVTGNDEKILSGDRLEGSVIHAELSSQPSRLDLPGSFGGIEYMVPMAVPPSGGYLHAEIAGLDPESWIEIGVNGESLGSLGTAPFALNNPRVVFTTAGRLLLAGWRTASIFLPLRLWKTGDNSVVLTLHRVTGDAGLPVTLRRVHIDFLFNSQAGQSGPFASPSVTPASTPPLPVAGAFQSASAGLTGTPIQMTSAPSNVLLSNGSLYGNPPPSLFHAAPPAILP